MKTVEFYDLPSNQQDIFLGIATEWLVEHGHLPWTEEVWESDKYSDRIYEKANELWEEYCEKSMEKQEAHLNQDK